MTRMDGHRVKNRSWLWAEGPLHARERHEGRGRQAHTSRARGRRTRTTSNRHACMCVWGADRSESHASKRITSRATL